MRNIIVVSVVVALSFVVACSKQDKDAEPATTPTPTVRETNVEPAPSAPLKVEKPEEQAPQPVGETTVEVLSPGAEPRKALRYKYKQGQKERVAMEMKMAVSSSDGPSVQPERRFPTMRTVMDLEVSEVSETGEAVFVFKMAGAEILRDEEVPTPVRSMMEKELKSGIGTSARCKVTDRGVTLMADVSVPDNASMPLKKSLENMRQQILNLATPLPEEPVGKGARWKVTVPMVTPEIRFSQVATYELLDCSSDVVKLAVSLTQHGASQEMTLPGIPPSATANLESLDTTGTVKMDLDLTRLTPKSEAEMESATKFTITHQGEDRRMATNTKVMIKISRGE